MRILKLPLRVAVTAVFALAVVATAIAPGYACEILTATLRPLNDSGVSGTARLVLEPDTLTVTIRATGLEPGRVHAQHIHGRFDAQGRPFDSVAPTAADDTDRDGFIEVAEGAASYGPVIVPLTAPPGGAAADFPTAPDGTITFEQTYDLRSNATFANTFRKADLLPLEFREIVLHGMTVGGIAGLGTPGEVNGVPGYKELLPVAFGELAVIPEPGTVVLIGLGGGILVLAGRRFRQR